MRTVMALLPNVEKSCCQIMTNTECANSHVRYMLPEHNNSYVVTARSQNNADVLNLSIAVEIMGI